MTAAKRARPPVEAAKTPAPAALARRYPGQHTGRNLFRMRQFFEAYDANAKLSPLVTRLPTTPPGRRRGVQVRLNEDPS